MLIIEHNYTKLKLGRVRIYQLNTFKTFTDDENAIYNDKKKKNTELLEAIHNNESVRTVSDKYLNERNEIVIFENDIVRLALADRGYKKCDYQLLDEIIYMVINHNEILWQIIDKGIIIGGKKYKLFTATTGQVRNCKVTLIKEEFYEAHKSFLMAGLTVDGINADKGNDNKGMNVGKYLSYNALLLSSSKLPPKNIDIDKCIVVDGLKTVVNGKVKYIDIKTDDNGQCYVNDTPKEYQTKRISIEHTDGAGMFIPGELPSSCQIRGGYIKGAMFPFDFRLFAHEVSHNSILVDPWGTPHDVEKEDIRYILTTSQLKMWKQYSSWEEYKKKFKENNLKLSINAYAEPPKEEVTFSYQFLQTLPYNTDITELCQPAICIVVSALILAYIFARIFRCKYLIYVLDFLKIRDTGNVYYWDDLMDNDYPMKVKVSYNENVYEGMLHNYESYSNEPHIVLTSYIVKDKSDNVLDDFRDDNTKIIILDTSEAEKVEVIYAKNSTICKDLRELCNSNSSLFNDRNNEEQD